MKKATSSLNPVKIVLLNPLLVPENSSQNHASGASCTWSIPGASHWNAEASGKEG
jgi:hypothetical protein